MVVHGMSLPIQMSCVFLLFVGIHPSKNRTIAAPQNTTKKPYIATTKPIGVLTYIHNPFNICFAFSFLLVRVSTWRTCLSRS